MHAEGFAGGELKHGPIALIDQGTPVVAIMPTSGSLLAEKMASNIQEVKARGAIVIVISESDFAGADSFYSYSKSESINATSFICCSSSGYCLRNGSSQG